MLNGRVYFQHGDGTGGVTGNLIALDGTTGTKLWAAPLYSGSTFDAPAINDAGIFVAGGSGTISINGYNFDGSNRFSRVLSSSGANWSPTLSGDRLFSWLYGTFTEHNPADGTTVWNLGVLAGTSLASSGMVAVQGNSAILLGTDLACVDLTTRALRWKVAGSFAVSFPRSPAIGTDRVFAVQGTAFRSFSLADGSPGLVYQIGASDDYAAALVGQPIIFNDRLMVSNETTTWIFNLADGSVVQTLAAGGRLSYANGYLLAAGDDNVLRAFLATPQPRLGVELAGTPLAPAAGVDFHAPLIGQSSALVFTLRNTGLADLTGLAATIAGDYWVTGTPPGTVAPGASATFTVTFTPTVPGTRSAVLHLASNDPAANPFALNLTGKGNHAPTFAGYAATTTANRPLTLHSAKITARASDPDGDSVTLTQAFGPGSQGGTVALAAGRLTYTPPAGFTGGETVEVELRDANGATVRGLVALTVIAEPVGTGALGRNLTDFTLRGGRAEMIFRGIPGRVYTIQRSTDLSAWVDLGNVTAGADGKIPFTDPAPPAPQGFYRTRAN